jgi:hypothetical protein
MRASDWLENALCEHLRGTPLAAPSGFYVSLHTADPTDAADPSTEVRTDAGWSGYARQSMGQLSGAWTALAADAGNGGRQYVANANALTFPANTGAATVAVTYVGVWDAATGGNMWFYAPLINLHSHIPYTLNVSQGSVAKIPEDVLRLYMPVAWSGYLTGAFAAHLAGAQMAVPSALFVGLDSGDGALGGALVAEVSVDDWPSYARVPLGTPLSSALTSATDEAGGGKYVSNVNALLFPVYDGETAAVTVTAHELWDAATGGNMWWRGSLGVAVALSEATEYTLVANGLRLLVR